jgi:hypothetical protein
VIAVVIAVIAMLVVALAVSMTLAVALRQRVLSEDQAAYKRSANHAFCKLHSSLLGN